ncbi:MAG TPA: GNAT family N-acetyltransferase [Anaerolineaceae bacterium]
MSAVEVRPVGNRRERQIFLTFPWRVYRGDPLWVPPLLPDWSERIDLQRGVFFKRGTADFFIAWRDGQPVGTICAAEDRQANEERGVREAVFGFFNFTEDYAVMEALLGRVREWARERGLDTLTGPYNLDYEDSYGILVEGRDRPPTLMCGHTPPYYLDFVERYGFQPARGDNLAYALDLTAPNPALDELAGMAARVRARRNFTVRPADLTHWEEELDRIHGLLNRALRHLPDFRTWPREVVFNSLAPFRTIADPELVLFGEADGETIGWLPGLPDLNEAFIHAEGLRHPWNYLDLWLRMRRRPGCLTVKSVLVPPEHWGSGLVILLFDEMVRRARERGYRWIDGSLTSADNPRTPALADRLGAKLYKRIRVYRMEV